VDHALNQAEIPWTIRTISSLEDMKNFNVTFWNKSGESLGIIPVKAMTELDAKIIASALFKDTWSWSTQTVEVA
jgi:hypothetical protein